MDTTIEWESATTRLVKIDLPRHPNFPKGFSNKSAYYQVQGRKISKIFVHQSAGSSRDGIDAPKRIASWIIGSPRYRLDEEGNQVLRRNKPIWIGGGRGFPGTPYTFQISSRPDVVDGKSIVYRCWSDEWVTWHTRRFNRVSVGICFAGNFQTRHSTRSPDRHPTSMAMEAGFDLIENYLLPRYGLDFDDLMGHFDAGKAACPGDQLEAKIRRLRGETVEWFHGDEDVKEPELDMRPLNNQKQRVAALQDLGFGEWWDLLSADGYRLAIEAVQLAGGIVQDGIYGPQSDKALRQLLAEWGSPA